jgi:cytochrome c oxidase cbb3-type subunit I/II
MANDPDRPILDAGLIRAHTYAALAMVLYSALLGLTIAAKFHWPDFLTDTPWLTWGRLRYAHTQGIFFGWLGNAFLAFLYYAVPNLADRPVTSRRLGWLLWTLWNLGVVIPGWAAVQLGYAQPLEWAEFPLAVDAVVVVAFVLSIVQFVVPLFRRRLGGLYVAGWYVLGGIVFTALAYPVGNVVPELVPGARGATYSGLWIHDAVGLYVTPLALAIAYIVIPVVTRQPIYSHFLSMIGFWLLFFIYPLNGTHHYVFSSIPMDAQQGAIVASVYLGVDVILVVMNLLLSFRGAASDALRDVPLRFVRLGVILYLIVGIQGSLQALMPVNRFIHFSDWVIGHAHLAMIGFASFLAIGGILHVWQRTPGCRYSPSAAVWSYWLLSIGLTAMVLDLTAAGLIQGHLWESESPWMESVRSSQVYWLLRTFSGMILFAGFLVFGASLFCGRPVPARAAARPVSEPTSHAPPLAIAWLHNAYLITAVAGVVVFALSFYALAIVPNREIEADVRRDSPTRVAHLTSAEERGRQIYGREGCVNCHTQLIRTTEADVRRFGVASQAWEYENDYPQLWGTRRIGPDLARSVGRHPRDWHLAHLWNPRHVVPDSIMPAYPWLFDGSAKQPTAEATDLVAYLDSLGRDAQSAGVNSPRALPGLDPAEERRRGMFCDCDVPRTAGPAPVFAVDGQPGERDRLERRGDVIFRRECSGCHGMDGRGNGPAADALLLSPRDLTSNRYSAAAVSKALWKGVPGTAMPSFHELQTTELRALVARVQSLGPPPENAPPLDAESAKKAESLFGTHCIACHGNRGVPPSVFKTTLAPAPTNFREVQPTLPRATAVLADGIPGTAMIGWKTKLSEEDRLLLAKHVRSFFAAE